VSRAPHPARGIAIVAGPKFIYRHPTLAPLALPTYIWLVADSIAMTVLGLVVLRELGLTAAGYGLVLARRGSRRLLGGPVRTVVGRWPREGNAIIVGRLLWDSNVPTRWATGAVAPRDPGAGQRHSQVGESIEHRSRCAARGLVAAALGFRGTLIVVTAVFMIASLVAALSPLRGARA
jgi:hypothetical protein